VVHGTLPPVVEVEASSSTPAAHEIDSSRTTVGEHRSMVVYSS
jgi:hypothetical protein